VEKEVPDRFSHDDSMAGRVVDILVGERRRSDMYSDEEPVVNGAIWDLERAYEMADKIVALFPSN
jgi:hypothetical protein